MSFMTKLFGSKPKENYALDMINASFGGRQETRHLVKALPGLAANLYGLAEQGASEMTKRLKGRDPRRLLAECIFELELVGGFDEVAVYSGDVALASFYVDALLFQATGLRPSPEPVAAHYLGEGTHTCRGIAKYRKAKDYFKVADPSGWLFGEEYSAIVSGNAKDIAHIAAVLPVSVSLRAEGKWRTRFALTGHTPSRSERDAVRAMVEKSMSNL
jgi:hypothetical protein